MHAPYSFSPRARQAASGCLQLLGYTVGLAVLVAAALILAVAIQVAPLIAVRP